MSKAVLKRADDVLTQLWEVSRTLGDMGNSPPCASFARAEMGSWCCSLRCCAPSRCWTDRVWPVLRWATAWTRWISASRFRVRARRQVWSDVVLPAAPNLHYSALADGGYAIFLNRGDFLGAAELLART